MLMEPQAYNLPAVVMYFTLTIQVLTTWPLYLPHAARAACNDKVFVGWRCQRCRNLLHSIMTVFCHSKICMNGLTLMT